jgi:hypothetical protein
VDVLGQNTKILYNCVSLNSPYVGNTLTCSQKQPLSNNNTSILKTFLISKVYKSNQLLTTSYFYTKLQNQLITLLQLKKFRIGFSTKNTIKRFYLVSNFYTKKNHPTTKLNIYYINNVNKNFSNETQYNPNSVNIICSNIYSPYTPTNHKKITVKLFS